MTKRQLTTHLKQWRTANLAGTRLAFCAHLIERGHTPPPTGELMATWRAFDATRTITQPATTDDAKAILLQDGIGTERGLAAYRYLVECGQANEEILLSVV